MARAGRRRRVLNEEVRAAGHVAEQSPISMHAHSADAPRYGEQASIENHPQVTDFVPRRYRIVLFVVFAGMLCSVLAESAARYADQLALFVPSISGQQIAGDLVGPFVTWCSAMVFLLIGVYARMIYMLRRHRVDDYRGHYRVWRIATWAALALSLNAVVGLHVPVARVLGSWSGWNLLANQSGWWLLGAVLVGGWIMLRLAIDMASCRSALTAVVVAIACYLAAGIAAAGWWPEEWLGAWSGLMVRSMPLAGNILLLAAVMLNARYVVLDVQGLISTPIRTPSRTLSQEAASNTAVSMKAEIEDDQVEELPTKKRSTQTTRQSNFVTDQSPAKETTEWVDGTDAQSEAENRKPRRLSKTEKKRLRKIKSRKAA
jgi:hypothetical protein